MVNRLKKLKNLILKILALLIDFTNTPVATLVRPVTGSLDVNIPERLVHKILEVVLKDTSSSV